MTIVHTQGHGIVLCEPESPVVNAEGEDVVGLIRAAGNARDRFIVIAMWRMGLRRGELAGLRRSDIHFVPDASRLGCGFKGTHLHVVRRANPNGAWAKSRRQRVVPADWLTVQAYDQYIAERDRVDPAGGADFVLVNLFADPVGAPIRPGGINELHTRLSSRANLRRPVHPHMLRHSFATNVAEHGGTADVLKELLGHAWISSSVSIRRRRKRSATRVVIACSARGRFRSNSSRTNSETRRRRSPCWMN